MLPAENQALLESSSQADVTHTQLLHNLQQKQLFGDQTCLP